MLALVLGRASTIRARDPAQLGLDLRPGRPDRVEIRRARRAGSGGEAGAVHLPAHLRRLVRAALVHHELRDPLLPPQLGLKGLRWVGVEHGGGGGGPDALVARMPAWASAPSMRSLSQGWCGTAARARRRAGRGRTGASCRSARRTRRRTAARSGARAPSPGSAPVGHAARAAASPRDAAGRVPAAILSPQPTAAVPGPPPSGAPAARRRGQPVAALGAREVVRRPLLPEQRRSTRARTAAPDRRARGCGPPSFREGVRGPAVRRSSDGPRTAAAPAPGSRRLHRGQDPPARSAGYGPASETAGLRPGRSPGTSRWFALRGARADAELRRLLCPTVGPRNGKSVLARRSGWHAARGRSPRFRLGQARNRQEAVWPRSWRSRVTS